MAKRTSENVASKRRWTSLRKSAATIKQVFGMRKCERQLLETQRLLVDREKNVWRHGVNPQDVCPAMSMPQQLIPLEQDDLVELGCGVGTLTVPLARLAATWNHDHSGTVGLWVPDECKLGPSR
eukprot:1549860-Amphidinium_carterae.1